MNVLDEALLPCGKASEVMPLVCNVVDIFVLFSIRACMRRVPKDVLFGYGRQMIGLEIDTATGLKESNCHCFLPCVAWSALVCFHRIQLTRFRIFSQGVEEDLATDFGWYTTIEER